MIRLIILLFIPLFSFSQVWRAGKTPRLSIQVVADALVPTGDSVFNIVTYGGNGNDNLSDNDAFLGMANASNSYALLNPTTHIVWYFPDGTYYVKAGVLDENYYAGLSIYGHSKYNTKIVGVSSTMTDSLVTLVGSYRNMPNIRTITLQNAIIYNSNLYNTTNTIAKSTSCTDVYFKYTETTGSTYILLLYGLDRTYTFTRCVFEYDDAYMGMYMAEKNHLTVTDCYFSGDVAHHIRVSGCESASITDNTVIGGTTGIFIGSQRRYPIENVTISGNTVHGQSEEGISLDGFGNNYDLCPVIGNGAITAISNDGTGRLVLTTVLRHAYNNEGGIDTLTVDSLNTWTNFYYSFSEGSGLEGKYYKIYAFDSVNNTLTIDTICPSDIVTVGGIGSVDAGFFDCTIANNEVYDVWGADSTYGTGLSIYLNVFGINIYGNNVHDCAHGSHIAGGLMLSVYRLKAWDNYVHDNTFTNCPEYGIKFQSLYTNDVHQYNNRLIDNVFTTAPVVEEDQIGFINTGNTITP